MRVYRERIGRLALCVLVPVVLAAAELAGQTPGEAEGRAAAEAWLALMDAGDYEATWAEAGETFRNAIPAEDWTRQATAVRHQVGDPVSRAFAGVQRLTDPPGAPPGEYLHVRYRSEYAALGTANELVTLAEEPDGEWRVVGYFVQPANDG